MTRFRQVTFEEKATAGMNELAPTGRVALQAARQLLKSTLAQYHRFEGHGASNIPRTGGVLLVSNHSGGVLSADVPMIATALWDQHGIEREFRILAHDTLMIGPMKKAFTALGLLAASPENAAIALRGGAATLVFPGGDWDAFRPSAQANRIDFGGRTGYVRAAVDANVPIVPVVSIGGHETQLILTRGEALARAIPLMRKIRAKVAPVVVGVPFGVTIAFPQFPLPSKIVTRFLEPVNLRDEFGPEPDPDEVDGVIRARMQRALDELAAARRFPVIG